MPFALPPAPDPDTGKALDRGRNQAIAAQLRQACQQGILLEGKSCTQGRASVLLKGQAPCIDPFPISVDLHVGVTFCPIMLQQSLTKHLTNEKWFTIGDTFSMQVMTPKTTSICI